MYPRYQYHIRNINHILYRGEKKLLPIKNNVVLEVIGKTLNIARARKEYNIFTRGPRTFISKRIDYGLQKENNKCLTVLH